MKKYLTLILFVGGVLGVLLEIEELIKRIETRFEQRKKHKECE